MKQQPKAISLQNDPHTKALLQNWLSVSESQICALEVLCAQLPDVSTLLETSMSSISERFVAMASDFEHYTTYTQKILEEQHASPNIGQKLESIIASLEHSTIQETKEQLEKLLTVVKTPPPDIERMNASHLAINQAIAQIIIDMQFQDRVSQNLVIVVKVLNAIIQYLQNEINDTISNFQEHNEQTSLDKEFATTLLRLLTLGELQHRFMDHLVKHHYISDYTELGYDPKAHPDTKKDSDDIDLF